MTSGAITEPQESSLRSDDVFKPCYFHDRNLLIKTASPLGSNPTYPVGTLTFVPLFSSDPHSTVSDWVVSSSPFPLLLWRVSRPPTRTLGTLWSRFWSLRTQNPHGACLGLPFCPFQPSVALETTPTLFFPFHCLVPCLPLWTQDPGLDYKDDKVKRVDKYFPQQGQGRWR